MKEIDLENVSGDDFESICREIFSKYYKVEVDKTPLVGDGGKDLIIRLPEPVYVECKHHKSTVGRPVVQKLHSAMTTDWVKKGIVVTTGSFSPDAIKHISNNNLPIELIDGKKLNEIALSVGIKLYFGYDVQVKEFMIDAPNKKDLHQMAIDHFGFVKSKPYSIEKQATIKEETQYFAYFTVDYTINQEFYNTKKDYLIHSINDGGKLFLDAESLEQISIEISTFYSHTEFKPTSECDNPPHIDPPHIRSDVENAAYEAIISSYSCEVPYVTTNNQNRVKKITPSKSHIQLSNYSMVYLPWCDVQYTILGKKREAKYLFNGTLFLELDSYICEICGKHDPENTYLCNECGSLVCSGHHRTCNICGKDICSKCGWRYKAGFLKTRIACDECVRKHPELKLKP